MTDLDFVKSECPSLTDSEAKELLQAYDLITNVQNSVNKRLTDEERLGHAMHQIKYLCLTFGDY